MGNMLGRKKRSFDVVQPEEATPSPTKDLAAGDNIKSAQLPVVETALGPTESESSTKSEVQSDGRVDESKENGDSPAINQAQQPDDSSQSLKADNHSDLASVQKQDIDETPSIDDSQKTLDENVTDNNLKQDISSQDATDSGANQETEIRTNISNIGPPSSSSIPIKSCQELVEHGLNGTTSALSVEQQTEEKSAEIINNESIAVPSSIPIDSNVDNDLIEVPVERSAGDNSIVTTSCKKVKSRKEEFLTYPEEEADISASSIPIEPNVEALTDDTIVTTSTTTVEVTKEEFHTYPELGNDISVSSFPIEPSVEPSTGNDSIIVTSTNVVELSTEEFHTNPEIDDVISSSSVPIDPSVEPSVGNNSIVMTSTKTVTTSKEEFRTRPEVNDDISGSSVPIQPHDEPTSGDSGVVETHTEAVKSVKEECYSYAEEDNNVAASPDLKDTPSDSGVVTSLSKAVEDTAEEYLTYPEGDTNDTKLAPDNYAMADSPIKLSEPDKPITEEVNNSNLNGPQDSLSNGLNDHVTTEFRWEYGGDKVFVSGTFNQWSHDFELSKMGDVFVGTVDLAAGEYQFKYIVDDEWLVDRKQLVVTDEGRENNKITVQKEVNKIL